MNTKKLLETTNHRPWHIPKGNWKYYQEWNNAIFLHWQVDLVELKKLVPKELEIDLFDGKPWVSLVAFTMEKMRPKNLPAFPPISNFDEINIRTYIKSNNKTGVYFLSIEGGTNLSCKLAKGIAELPYRYSKMERSEEKFESSNSAFGDQLRIEYQTGKELSEKTALDKWLTERYALFQNTKTAINTYEIHHLEWPINHIKVNKLRLVYSRFKQLINNEPHRVHYSTGVNVLAWGKRKVDKASYPLTS